MAITFVATKHLAGGKIQLELAFFCEGTEFARGTAHLEGDTLHVDTLACAVARIEGLNSTAQALFTLAKKYRDVETSQSVAKQLSGTVGR